MDGKNRNIESISKYQAGKISNAELLAELLLNLDKKDIKDLIFGLLSNDERKMLANRLLIIKMLKEEFPQHEIASKLKVGVETVARGVKEIQKGRFKFI